MLQRVSTCVFKYVQQVPGLFAFIHCVIEHSLSTYCVFSPCLAWVWKRNGLWEGKDEMWRGPCWCQR